LLFDVIGYCEAIARAGQCLHELLLMVWSFRELLSSISRRERQMLLSDCRAYSLAEVPVEITDKLPQNLSVAAGVSKALTASRLNNLTRSFKAPPWNLAQQGYLMS